MRYRLLLLVRVLFLSTLAIGASAAARAQGTINANFTASPTSGCAPLTVNFTDLTPGVVTTWSWDVDNNGSTDYTIQNPTHVYSTPGTYTVRLSVTDAPGPNTGTLVVTNYIRVFAPPTANAGPDRNLCNGGTVQIGAAPTGSGGTPPYTYAWAPATNLSSTTVARPVVSSFSGAPVTYTVTVTDANGCVGTDQVVVTPVPSVISDAGPDIALCRGFSTMIGGAPSASAGTPPYTYSWSPATGLSSTTIPNPIASPLVTTVYSLTVTDAAGCMMSEAATITVNPTITVNAGTSRNVCFGVPTTIGGTPTATGGTGPYTYVWSPAAGLSSTTISNPVATVAAPVTYRVVVTDALGCRDSNTVTLTPVPAPTVSAGPDQGVCPGDPAQIGGLPTASGGSPPYTYTWSPATGLSSISVPNPVATPTITTSYVVAVTDVAGCVVRDTVVVTAYPQMTVNAGSPATLCIGNNTVLGGVPTVVGGTGPYTYLWSPTTGLSSPTIANPVASPSVTTNYQLVVVDQTGCRDTATVTVTVAPRPVSEAGPNVVTCSNVGVPIGGAPSATSGTPPYSYQWSPAIGLSSATIPNPIAAPTAPTTYTLVVTDVNGCISNPDTVRVTVFPVPVANVLPAGPVTFCQGDSATLTVTQPFARYLWSNGDTTRSTRVRTSGSYSVIVTDINGCRDTSNPVSVTVNPTTIPTITATGPTSFCQGDSVTLIASPGFVRYRWSNGDTNAIITVKTTGNYRVTATDLNGCATLSAPTSVTARPNPVKPTITASGPRTFCQGDSVILQVPAGYATYQWSSGETVRRIIVKTAGRYAVVVGDTSGCRTLSDSVTIVVNPLPTPLVTVNGPTRFCQGDSTSISAPVGYVAYLWSTGARTRTITVKTTGDYWVDVTDTNLCRARSDTASIQMDSLPKVKLTTSGPPAICQGDSVSIQAPTGFVVYQWSNGAPTPTINVAQAGSYWVLLTDTNGCIGRSDTIRVTVNPNPTPKITVNGPTTVCDGDTVTLSAPLGMARYIWSNGDSTRVSRIGRSGDYWVRVFDNRGCQGYSDTVSVTVNPKPVARLTIGGPTSVCQGDSVILIAPPGFVRYAWSNGATSPAIIARSTGNYFVRVTDTNSCVAPSDTVAVRVNAIPVPTITFNGPRTICNGDTTILSAPSGYVTYLWSNGETTQSISATIAGAYTVTVSDTNGCTGTSRPANLFVRNLPAKPTLSVITDSIFCQGDSTVLRAPIGYASYTWSTGEKGLSIVVRDSGSYWVTVADAFGCDINSDTINVTVNAPPTKPDIVVNGPSTFCENDSTELIAPFGYVAYLWSNGDTNAIVTVRAGGDYTVMVTDVNGCSSLSDPVTITMHDMPRPELTTDRPTTVCFGDTVTISAPEGYAAYIWSNGDFTRQTKVIDFGDYFVRVIDTLGCEGISDTVTINVNIPPVKPVVNIVGPSVFCEGDSATLQAPSGMARYLWSTGDTTESIVVRAAGDFQVAVFDANGCTNISDTVQIRTWPSPVPIITASGPTAICEGSSVQLAADSGYTSYLWSNGDTNRVITVLDSGNYQVMVTDTRGCRGLSEPTQVAINALPMPTIESAGRELCPRVPMTISAPEGMIAYLWSTGDTTRSIDIMMPGSYQVQVTDSNGCIGVSDTVMFTMRPEPRRPELTIEGPTIFCEGDSTVLVAQGGFLEYIWSNGDTGRVIIARRGGMYSVQALDTTGCYGASDTMEITMRPMPRPSLAVIGTGESCLGDSIRIIAPPGYVSYRWSTGDTNRVIWAKVTGQYWLAVVDTNGCPGWSDTASVKLTPLFENMPLQITGRTEYCEGDSTILTAPVGYAGYRWTTGDTVRQITVRTTGEYAVTMFDRAGCQGLSDTVRVIVHPTPVVPIISSSGRPVICRGDTIELSAPAGFTHYLWSNGATTPSILVADAGSYQVQVVDSFGCSATSEETRIEMHDKPYVAIQGRPRVCQDSLSTFWVPAMPGVEYHWQIAGATATIFDGQGTGAITVRWLDSGMATISVFATDTASGCYGESSYDVNVEAPFVPVITGDQVICLNDSTMLDAGPDYLSYLWSTGDTTRSILVHDGGVYTVMVGSRGGCFGTASFEVRGLKSAPRPTISVINPNQIASDSVQLIVQPGAFLNYAWFYNDQPVPEWATRTITVRNNGLYRVEVVDSNGCHGASEVEVTMLHRAITGISLPSMRAQTNDTVEVPLRLDYAVNIDTTMPLTWTATIRFNKTMLMPVDTTVRGVIDGDDRVITLRGHYIGGPGTLAELRFLTMLGNAEETAMTLESFAWSDSTINVEMINGSYYADGICKEGGSRLFNATGALTLEQNRPNPASTVTEIEYETNEDGRISLIVADMSGNIVARLVDGETSSGRYLVRYNVGGLATGTYLIRLTTAGGTLSRIMQVGN